MLIGGGILVAVGVGSLILAITADVKADRTRKLAASAAVAEQAAPVAGGAEATPTDVPPVHVDDHGALTHAGDAHAAGDAHGHDHSTSKAPWLILVPVLVLLLVAPPALGADAVARNASSQGLAGYDVVLARGTIRAARTAGAAAGAVTSSTTAAGRPPTPADRGGTMHFPALEGTNPSVTIKDFVLRALYDADNSVQDTPVTVTGFIAPAGEGYTDGYTIARMVISCCAADANPMQLHVAGDPPFPDNTWVDAVVTVVADTATLDNGYVPTVTLTTATTVGQPDDPYEH